VTVTGYTVTSQTVLHVGSSNGEKCRICAWCNYRAVSLNLVRHISRLFAGVNWKVVADQC
jgi:hypothetical protein